MWWYHVSDTRGGQWGRLGICCRCLHDLLSAGIIGQICLQRSGFFRVLRLLDLNFPYQKNPKKGVTQLGHGIQKHPAAVDIDIFASRWRRRRWGWLQSKSLPPKIKKNVEICFKNRAMVRMRDLNPQMDLKSLDLLGAWLFLIVFSWDFTDWNRQVFSLCQPKNLYFQMIASQKFGRYVWNILPGFKKEVKSFEIEKADGMCFLFCWSL